MIRKKKKTESEKKIGKSISIAPKLLKKITSLAEKDGVSVSRMYETAMLKMLKKVK